MTQIRWMFHSTAMVRDYDRAVEDLAALGGLSVLEYSQNDLPGIGRRGGMCWIGDNSIEVGQPTVDTGAAARFVERSGGGMHSIAVQVPDIEEAAEHVESCGVRVASRPMPEMFFTDPRDTHGVLVEWGAFELDIDPHFGATPPPRFPGALIEVTRHAFVGAIVEDPSATGELLARLFGTDITFTDEAGAGSPRVGVGVGDCTLALYDLPGARSLELWGRAYDRPRVHLLGLSVDVLADSEYAVRDSDIAVIRREEGIVVIDPSATGDVQVVLVEQLLPGDPRK